MNRIEKIPAWLLRVAGLILLLAVGAVFMPFAWMNVVHEEVGLGALPHIPIIGYLTRSVSALYALHGALLIFVASDVHRYLPVMRFLAWAGGVFGVVMLGLDLAAGMPLAWTIGEGPWVVLLSAVALWLTGRVKTQGQSTGPGSLLPKQRQGRDRHSESGTAEG